jgi:hypothetical protein
MQPSHRCIDLLRYASAYANHSEKFINTIHLWAAFLEMGEAAARVISFRVNPFRVRHWLDRTLRGVLPDKIAGNHAPEVESIMQEAENRARLEKHACLEEEHLFLAFLSHTFHVEDPAMEEAFEAVALTPSYKKIKQRRAIDDLRNYLDDPRFPFDCFLKWQGMTSSQWLDKTGEWLWLEEKLVAAPIWMNWVVEPLTMICNRRNLNYSYAYYRHGARVIWPDDGGRHVSTEPLVKA